MRDFKTKLPCCSNMRCITVHHYLLSVLCFFNFNSHLFICIVVLLGFEHTYSIYLYYSTVQNKIKCCTYQRVIVQLRFTKKCYSVELCQYLVMSILLKWCQWKWATLNPSTSEVSSSTRETERAPGKAAGRAQLKAKQLVCLCGHRWILLQVNAWWLG